MSNKFYRDKRPGPKRKTTNAPFSQEIQDQVVSFLEQEFSVASRNTELRNRDLNDIYDMIHCERTTKNDWEPDISLPDFTSRLLTQIGNFVSQYFGSTDFVETASESDDPWDVAEAKASKYLLNSILNDKKSRYYAKLIRLLMFVFPTGSGFVKFGYNQKTKDVMAGTRKRFEPVLDTEGRYMADDGTVYNDAIGQKPMMEGTEEPVYETKVIEDRPTFDVYPNQYVHVSQEYAYSLQEKEYVIFETKKTLNQLKQAAEYNRYFNLELLDDVKGDTDEFDKKTVKIKRPYDEAEAYTEKFIVLERHGNFPAIFDEDDNGDVIYGTEKPGIDKNGEMVKKAELKDCIITYVKKPGAGTGVMQMIGFKIRKTTLRPMTRFLCYIDSLEDNGFGDGEVNMGLQTASDDMYNLSNFRTQLATTPAFKGKRFSGFPDKIDISPEKVIGLENIEDLQEIVIQDNMAGALQHLSTLSSKMDYAMATSPATMGMEPDRRETATVGSIIDRRASVRIGMKSMTLEFVGFTEMYDVLLSLCNDFMLPQTIRKHCGKYADYYNPEREDRFKPVSQALETDESKREKVKMWYQLMSAIVNVPNPKTPMLINYIFGQILEIWGGDFKTFRKFMLTEDPEAILLYQLAIGNSGGAPPQGMPGGVSPTQNQTGLPQGGAEQGIRALANG